MAFKLKENEAEILAQWANGKDLRLGRRAWLVYESSKGVTTKELSKAVAMTEQRVVEIIDRYKDSGLLGLIEKPRSGRAKKISSDIVQDLVDEMPHKSIGEINADELVWKIQQDKGVRISKDAIWRQARISGISLNRESKKQASLTDLSRVMSGLLGVVISPRVKLLAILKDQKVSLPMLGYVEITCASLAKMRNEKIESLFEAIELIKNERISRVSDRSKNEAITRWANNVSTNAKRKTGFLELILYGDYGSSEMHDWLKGLKRFDLTEGAEGMARRISFASTQEEWASDIKGLCNVLPSGSKFPDFIWAKRGRIDIA